MKNLKLLIVFTLVLLGSCKNSTKESDNKSLEPTTEISGDANTVTLEVKIEGMTCNGCEQTIENAVIGLTGVRSVDAFHDKGNAIIEVDTTVIDTVVIKSKIDETGYKSISFVSDAVN